MPDLQHLIRIAAPAQTVYPLVRTADGLSRWWAQDVEEDTDERVRLGFFNRATVYGLRCVEGGGPLKVTWACESGHEWTGTRLTFELAPTADETTVRFTHAAWNAPTDYFHSCNTVWGELMFRLKAEAEGKKPGPLFRRDSLAY